jgi:asparagine synthetase B (glutamine-hydrolysing)
MCGIGVTVLSDSSSCNDDSVKVPNVLQRRRGPDCAQVVQVAPHIWVEATVLHMRGATTTPQPVSLEKGVFCWNGEVYQIQQEDESIQELDADISDTELLSNMFNDALPRDKDESSMLQTITNVLRRVVNGEFAFCVVNETNVYFGRDKWGRRSLLQSDAGDGGAWRLSSVATDCSLAWTEVPPGCVYQYNIETRSTISVPLTPIVPKLVSVGEMSSERPPHVSQSMWLASFQLQGLLTKAVQRRCACYKQDDGVAIMFSGGLDSVVLTALVAQVLSPDISVDLINVSFQGDKSADRQAAIKSYGELKELYPVHIFRLLCVEADWEQVVAEERRIEQVMFPKKTTMDLNISTALWFTARGKGILLDSKQPYESTSRIIIMGMGADELMGGYGRHRKYFLEYGGEDRLRQELEMDQGRLWERNLGRDDRLVSDHGKEARFPYLDPNVVEFITKLPLADVCDFSQESGVGDKMILRLVAQRLGLQTASGLVKRAIQFGSRIAHLSDKKRFGSRRKATGQSYFRGTTEIGAEVHPNTPN